uniref:HECT domain-containing protein n=1 Tax=Steinernema glaseri TaxID=37863 RepID=A0A1I7YSS9_9BILA
MAANDGYRLLELPAGAEQSAFYASPTGPFIIETRIYPIHTGPNILERKWIQITQFFRRLIHSNVFPREDDELTHLL